MVWMHWEIAVMTVPFGAQSLGFERCADGKRS